LVRVAQTAKDPKVGVGGRLVVEKSIGNSEIDGLARAAVEEVCSGSESLGPIGGRHVRLKEKSAGNVIDSAYSTLSFAVLWRGVGTGHAKMNTMACEKLDERRVDKLRAIVRLECNYRELELCVCIGNKVNEDIASVGLVPKRKIPHKV
jgi:hypothetical protein